MRDLDGLDRQILYELDVNSRQPASLIAKKLKVNESEVSSRIKEMVDSRVILSFSPILNVYKFGYCPYRISITFKNLSEEKQEDVFEALNARDDVGWLVSCKGRWDMSVAVWAKDTYEFQEFLNNFLQEYGKFVEKKKVAVVHRLYLYSRACLLGDEDAANTEKREVISEGKPTKISDEDRSLIAALGINARADSHALSRVLGETPESISARINSLLEKEVIHGFRIRPNFGILGIKYHKVYLHLSEHSRAKRKKLMDYARKNPYIVYIDEAFGGGDVELEFQVNQDETFFKQLAEFRDKFDDLIRDQEVVTFKREYKFKFNPPRPQS
ncbi:MAG: Lrp/AsnC family transcriptional regulator [bacterium]|nr:Lrp/AsnC family transcriptional regulator [bacterium]